jgi:hypothetical protein
MKERTNAGGPASPEELVAQIQRLMDEVEALVASPAGADGYPPGPPGVDSPEPLAGADPESNGAGRFRGPLLAGAGRVDQTIRRNPYQALAAALGIGIVLGAMLGRRD